MGRSLPTRIVIADDDPIVRDVLRRTLRHNPEIMLVGEAENGRDTIRLAIELKPDVLLLDLLMPLLSGMDTLRELASEGTDLHTIVLCAFAGKRQIIEALQLGARAILLKKYMDQLATCIDAVMDGYYWVEDRKSCSIGEITSDLLSLAPTDPAAVQKYNLTSRELQIISLVTLGNTNREIGSTLCISEETVKRHLANIFNKTGMSTRVELAMLAVDRHLVSL